MVNDAHCHFLSETFFRALARQRTDTGLATDPDDLYRELGWDAPGTAELLADRWVREMDACGVQRAILIASIPGDEASVAVAAARHPSRLVGFFMLDPGADDAVARTQRALGELGLKGLCLFPAMHHVPLDDDRTRRVVEAAAACPGAAVFVHCGVLSIGVRGKLGLPSPFDLRLGDPLAVSRLALTFPDVPFLIPHFGAGLLRETLMAVSTCANIHLDTSSSNSWVRYTPGLTLDAVFAAALAVAGATRVLFGSDSSFFPRGWQRGIHAQQADILNRLDVSASDAALILGGNFDRLLSR
ncbi:MAG: amidohydrolase family protein [Acidobacteria bacterium]|nr:amidohydrolase family protein [Acidobacteriota bacterium]